MSPLGECDFKGQFRKVLLKNIPWRIKFPLRHFILGRLSPLIAQEVPALGPFLDQKPRHLFLPSSFSGVSVFFSPSPLPRSHKWGTSSTTCIHSLEHSTPQSYPRLINIRSCLILVQAFSCILDNMLWPFLPLPNKKSIQSLLRANFLTKIQQLG